MLIFPRYLDSVLPLFTEMWVHACVYADYTKVNATSAESRPGSCTIKLLLVHFTLLANRGESFAVFPV